MKRACLLYSFVILFSVTILGNVRAETVPFSFAFISPVQTSQTIDSVKGFRFNYISGINNDVTGFDIGFLNLVDGDQMGIQLGFYNRSFKSTGIQIGFMNKTEYLTGLQIGILNIHVEGDRRFFPIINFAF